MLGDVERSVHTQVATGEHMDDHAARIVGWNGLLLGLMVTAAGLAPTPPPHATVLVGGAGLCALLASVAGAVRCYRTTHHRVGLGPAALVSALEYDLDESDHLHLAIRGYAEAYDHNHAMLERSARAFTFSLRSFLAGLILLAIATGVFIIHAFP